MGKFHHDLTVLPNPGSSWLGFGGSSPNSPTFQVGEIL